MGARAVLVVAVLAAGCLGNGAAEDGKAHVYVFDSGPPAFVEIRSDDGVVWSARLAAGEGRLAEVPVPMGGCLDVTLFAGFEGNEPDRPVRLLRLCDADEAPVRAEFSAA